MAFGRTKAPDHSAIARFRTGFLADACGDLFYQMARRLASMGELSKETVFIDGTKLEACANKYTFVWKKSVGKWEEKMFVKSFLDRQLLYDLHHSRFGSRNSYSKTDVDATFMHMKDDHMRNAQLKLGYNVQIGMDSEYIVAADVFQDRNDVWTLVPFLKQMEEHLHFRYPSVTADSGYESEEAYDYLKSHDQKPYIKPQTYEKWKKRSFKKDISKRENMEYDAENDTYI